MPKEGLYEKAKGRRRHDPHLRIYKWMWPALMERLSGNELKVLLYLMTFETGSNNGEIFMGARQASEGTGLDKKTAHKALVGLDRHGFIRPMELGYFQQKGGPATRWRLTFLPCGGKGPTHEWRKPPAEQKSWGENFPGAVGKIPQPTPEKARTVGKIPTVERDCARSLVGKNGTQSVASMQGFSRPASDDDLDPEIAGGPNSAGDGAAAEIAIRGQVAAFWKQADQGRRLALAATARVSMAEVRDYLDATGELPFPKQVALRAAVRSMSA